jgi:prepilin-type N-terminal cleavage/methylation domain-containing protein
MNRIFFTSLIKRSNKKTTPNLVSGFTLVELMVATSIFVVIMLASMGSLFTLLDASKTSRALRFAMDNVNFSMESMTRSIRMGSYYYSVPLYGAINSSDHLTTGRNSSSADGDSWVSFIPQGGTQRIGYKLHTDEDSGKSTLQKCDEGSINCVSIISDDVNIDYLKFIVKGSEPNDSEQAGVYILLKGTVMVKDVPNSFSVQTFASQRNF